VATKTFDTKSAAKAWVESEKRRLSGVVDAKLRNRRVQDAVDDFLTYRKGIVAETTFKTERASLCVQLPVWFKQRSVYSISMVDIERLLVDFLASGRAYSTMQRLRGVLHCFFVWSRRFGYRPDNPVSGAVVPRRTEPIRDIFPFSKEQLEERYEVWHSLNPRSAEVARFLGLTGLRFSEARALRVKDVVFDDYPAVFVRRAKPEGASEKGTKSGQMRRVPLAEALIPFIRCQMEGKASEDLLLPPLHKTRFKATLRWQDTSLGRTLHDLRHTAITLWLASGIDLSTVRSWAGHSSLVITSRYAHWAGTTVDKDSLAKLNSALGSQSAPRGTPGAREKGGSA
jgi:integrase